MFFLACSMALRMAMGTSRALPIPKPACPCWSPTTTSAEKLRFLPPLTTLVTRWMATTWSFRLFTLTSIERRTDKVSLRICFDIGSEFQPRFPRRCGQRCDTAMVLVPATVKHDLLDAGGTGALGDLLPDHLCGRYIASTLHFLACVLVERACRCHGAPAMVVDDLRV